jgi:Domain of unknown function (DUF4129)
VRLLDPIGGPPAQQAAEQELRKAEYHRDDPGLLERVFSWLGRRLADLVSGGTGTAALTVAVALVAAVLIFAAVRAGPLRRLARSAAPDSDDPLRPVAAADHRRRAAELESAGQLAEALREWLRAAVQTIEDRGVLDPRPGRTGAAVAREAGPYLPEAAAVLAAAMQAFDEIWFGGRPPSRSDVLAAHRAADAARDARIVRTRTSTGFVVPR